MVRNDKLGDHRFENFFAFISSREIAPGILIDAYKIKMIVRGKTPTLKPLTETAQPSQKVVMNKIYLVREQKVMLGRDLAE